jgi:hypothetical protein
MMAINDELVEVLVEIIDRRTEEHLIATAGDMWKSLSKAFSNYVGAREVGALLDRCIVENRLKLTFLKQSSILATGAELRTIVMESQAGLSCTEMVHANRALLGSFVALVVSLLGPTLSAQIIYAVASKR